MNVTKVQIGNMALARLGTSVPISTLEEESVEAQLVLAHWDLSRDLTLEAAPWPFARRRVSLALLTDEPPAEWGYAYAWPSDALRLLWIADTTKRRVQGLQIPYTVEMRPDGTRAILCDEAEAVGVYTARNDVVVAWPAGFVQAMAWCLAEQLAVPLSRDQKAADRCHQMWIRAVHDGYAVAANQEHLGTETDAEWIRART